MKIYFDLKEAEMSETYDLIVIGGGPAGYSAAIEGAGLGAKVALIESDSLGGTCLNRGCIPVKTFLESTKIIKRFNDAEQYGINYSSLPSLNIENLINRKNEVISKLGNGLESMLKNLKIDIIKGNGRIVSQNEISTEGINNQRLTAKRIIIATGSSESMLQVKGHKHICVSSEALDLKEIPRNICIIGGGVVGVEFASFYSGAGSNVYILEAKSHILNTEDKEIVDRFVKIIKRNGVVIYEDSLIKSVESNGEDYIVMYEQQGKLKSLSVDMVLNAAGRIPNIKGIGIENCGIKCDANGYICVDKDFKTNIPGIYAAGDVIGLPLLAHAAFDEGIAAAKNALNKNVLPPRIKTIPRCIFTSPEIASAGLTEEQANGRGIKIKKGYCSFSSNGKALISGNTDGIIKIIVDSDVMQVIGVHILGETATEIIGSAVYAIDGEFTSEELSESILPHPTISEVIKEAAKNIMKQ
jgi:dihydrolipoamide dehydrogenase